MNKIIRNTEGAVETTAPTVTVWMEEELHDEAKAFIIYFIPALNENSGLFFMKKLMGMTDRQYMKRAVSLARRGEGHVNPNPLVGAVLVKDGKITGEGWHSFFGGPHAEVAAIEKAEGSVRGSTLYVTLEPCCHTGKTPPCTDLIISSGIQRVVAGIRDPNPRVSGKGFEILRKHRIEVTSGVMEEECSSLNEVFLKYTTTGRPFVVLKTAMTLDGKTATVDNASRWITGEKSRELVHRIRRKLSSVMAGIDTILYDDPMLNVRLKGKQNRSPLKVIVDSSLRIPLNSNVLEHEPQLCLIATTEKAGRDRIFEIRRKGAQVLICPEKKGRVDLVHLFTQLGIMEIDSVLVEGGSTLAFSLLEEGLIDKIVAFIAPKLFGGKTAPTAIGGEGFSRMEEALKLKTLTVRKTGEDLMIIGYPQPPTPNP